MSFLEEFDRRAKGQKGPEGENKELLDFADLVRSRRAVPTDEERRRVLARVRDAEARSRTGSPWYLLRTVAAAAAVLLCVGVLVATRKGPDGQVVIKEKPEAGKGQVTRTGPTIDVPGVAEPVGRKKPDAFSKIPFPVVKAEAVKDAAKKSVEKPGGTQRARILRSGGLVMVRRKGEKRWRVAGRGHELAPGDVLRTSRRLSSGARLLGPEGSRVTLAWGGQLRFDGPRQWHLAGGRAYFDVAKAAGLGEFRVSTPDGAARALGTEFLLSVQVKDRKRATFCWVDEGKVALSGEKGKKLVLAAGKSGRLTSGAAVPSKTAGDVDWLKVLEAKVGADHGIGELLARAVDANKSAPMQPLEVKSHRVSVTVVDQVARTFIDEVFVNNTYSRMQGVFYYTLPADAAVSEFAMYVNGKRVDGEVIEQKRARQIFEYIVRQRRDPALLEWAGGNLFKMRIFPIEPRSTKRIQLGYTQVLPRRAGRVTYSYPLVSEKLLKNPLHELAIDFRVLSSFGLRKLDSPSHRVARAMGEDGLRGALAFAARNYSPTRDFSVTYEVPDAPECAVFGNRPQSAGENYFMLQLCPRAGLPSRRAPERILVIVDGSASSGAQDYAVAGELASSVADMTSGWHFGVLRGGQRPELFGKGLMPADPETSVRVRDFLKKRPPLGGTDLLATFRAAAAAIKPGQRVKVVYVGDGVETLGEVEGSALADRIAGLFENLNVEISCAAVGSSYDRQVLSRLAGATGGVFVRVEGAAGVHAAVGQILDSFYQPLIRGVRVRVENLKASDIYPDAPVTVADGDTLVVLGRAGRTGRGKVILTGRTGKGAFRKTYDVELEADRQNNRFLPRLWAKAHIDSLFAQMGLAGASEDSRLRRRIIDTSVHYQIMSPFTAFLVLEGEEHFRKFGIKRRKKMWDWHGGTEGVLSTTREGGKAVEKRWEPPVKNALPPLSGPAEKPGEKLKPATKTPPGPPMSGEFREPGSFKTELRSWGEGEEERWDVNSPRRPAPLPTYYKESAGKYDYDPGARKDMRWREWDLEGRTGSLKSEAIRDWVEDATVPHSKVLVYPDDWKKIMARGQLDAISDIPLGGRARIYDARDLGFAIPHFPGPELGLSRYSRRRRGSYPQPIYWPSYTSPVLTGGSVVGLRIDRPLRSSAVYKRLIASGKAKLADRLNLSLALEREGKFAAAAAALKPVIAKMSEVPDLWLQLGSLLLRVGDKKGADAAFKKALELTPEKDRPAVRARMGQLLSVNANYSGAAELYRAAALASTNPAQAAGWAASAASFYRSAGRPEMGRKVWQALCAKWPRSGAPYAAAARWHLSGGDGPARAAALFGLARKHGAGCGAELVRALRRAGQGQEEAIEARAVLNTSKSASEVSATLYALAESHTRFAQREAARLLGPGTRSAQRTGVVYAMQSYPAMRTKGTLDALVGALQRGFPDEGRLSAFYALINGGRRTITLRGGKSGPVSEVLTPLLVDPGDPGKLSRAISAAHALGGSGFSREALDAAEKLLARRGLSAPQRLGLQQTLFVALKKLGRKEEAERRLLAAFAGVDDAAGACAHGWQVFTLHAGRKDFEKAADAVERGARRVEAGTYQPVYEQQAARLRTQLLYSLKSGLKPAEADKLIVRLAGKYPENVAFLSARAKILAGDGKYREAADFLRKAIKRLRGVPERIAKRPDLVRARAAGRAGLISLLSRVSAQDAKLRAAFLKEAASRREKEDVILRPWTQAALSCLVAAADERAYLKLLAELAAAEPEDPGWSRRLAAAYYRNGKLKEARKVYERLLKSTPDDATLALLLHGLCTRLKDAAAAKKYRDRALDALSLQPGLLQQYACQWQHQADRREWALEAWKRLMKHGPYARNGYAVWMAGSTAHQLGRHKEALDFYFRAFEAKGGGYGQAATNGLTNLWNQNRVRTEFKAALEKALAARRDGPRKVLLYILQSQTLAAGNPREARKILKRAAEVKLTDSNYTSAAYALVYAMVSKGWHDDAEGYARKGAGKLGTAVRRQMLRTAASYFNSHSQQPRARSIYRELLRTPDANENSDRSQLINILIVDNDLLGAERELRRMKVGSSNYYYVLYNAWNRVLNGYRNRGKHRHAARLAIEILDKYEADSNFYSRYGYQFISALNDAVSRGSLDAATRERVKRIVLTAAEQHFESDPTRQHRSQWYNYWYSYARSSIDKLGLRGKVDELAGKAGGGSDSGRVLRAAQYFQNRGKRDRAKKCYARALELPGTNRQTVLQHLYGLCSSYGTKKKDKADALKYLEELQKLGAYNQPTYLSQRIYLLYQLDRRKEARAACRELLDKPISWRQGYYWLGNVAGYCQNHKDWATAAEVWELAIRALRVYNRAYRRGRSDDSTLASYYGAAARCWAEADQGEKALACYLRGLSVIPRNNNSYYRRFLEGALKQFLKGRALDAAVAGYEKAVKESGGQEKPQLRLAFAEAYGKVGKTRKMLYNLQIAADLLPKDMRLRRRVIGGYKSLGEEEAVINAYLSWAKMDRQNIDIYRQLGDYYKSLGRGEEAMLAWATMAEVRPRESEGYRAYARKLVGHGQQKKAAVALRKAIRYRPTRHDIASELAGVYRRLKQEQKIADLWRNGEKACRQAMKDFADDPLPWLNLARFLKAQGKTAQARKTCEEILKRRWPRFGGETRSEAGRILRSLGRS